MPLADSCSFYGFVLSCHLDPVDTGSYVMSSISPRACTLIRIKHSTADKGHTVGFVNFRLHHDTDYPLFIMQGCLLLGSRVLCPYFTLTFYRGRSCCELLKDVVRQNTWEQWNEVDHPGEYRKQHQN